MGRPADGCKRRQAAPPLQGLERAPCRTWVAGPASCCTRCTILRATVRETPMSVSSSMSASSSVPPSTSSLFASQVWFNCKSGRSGGQRGGGRDSAGSEWLGGRAAAEGQEVADSMFTPWLIAIQLEPGRRVHTLSTTSEGRPQPSGDSNQAITASLPDCLESLGPSPGAPLFLGAIPLAAGERNCGMHRSCRMRACDDWAPRSGPWPAARCARRSAAARSARPPARSAAGACQGTLPVEPGNQDSHPNPPSHHPSSLLPSLPLHFKSCCITRRRAHFLGGGLLQRPGGDVRMGGNCAGAIKC